MSAVDAVDGLYESVVLHPDRWNDAAFADWVESVTADLGAVDRDIARELRRALRVATKLQRFWSSSDAERHLGERDWRSRVDLAVGPPAWRPTLVLAKAELAARPSDEAFEAVRDRFRLVNNQPWLEGITYEEWSAER